MKLTLNSYSEPLVIEVEKNGEVADTLVFELDFCDTNVFKMADMYQEVVDSVKDFDSLSTGAETIEAAKEVVEKVAPMIDMFAGEGATERIAAAFGKEGDLEGCLNRIIRVWAYINEKCIECSANAWSSVASKYLDEES